MFNYIVKLFNKFKIRTSVLIVVDLSHNGVIHFHEKTYRLFLLRKP